MEFECPACHAQYEIPGEDLPDRACDDVEWVCPNCALEILIGWYAVVEER